jgi:hypothetical protein
MKRSAPFTTVRPHTEIEREKESEILSSSKTGAERLSASDLVVAYVAARQAVGLETDQERRAILGRYAKRLLASGRWDDVLLVRATQQSGITNRHPRFLEEWASEYLTRSELHDYELRRAAEAEERRMDRGLSSMGDILRRAAAVPQEERDGEPTAPFQGNRHE